MLGQTRAGEVEGGGGGEGDGTGRQDHAAVPGAQGSRGGRHSKGIMGREPCPLPAFTLPLLLLLAALLTLSPSQSHVVHRTTHIQRLWQQNSSVLLEHHGALSGAVDRQSIPRALRAERPARRPCVGATVVLYVSREADFRRRLRFPRTRPVQMLLLRPITLSSTLVLGPQYSCTVIRTRPRTRNLPIAYAGQGQPLLAVSGTHNVWIQNVDLRHGLSTGAPPCASSLFGPGKESGSLVCPAVYIVQSFGVQINQGSVYGRIDIFRSVSVSLDHLKVTGPKVYSSGGTFNSFATHGFIRIGELASGTNLVGANIIVSNCEVYDGWELITLYRGAVGVTITRNFLHDFLFVGIRCGADVAYVMDCHNNRFTNNYIRNPPEYAGSITDVNNAGIYTCTHFFNPGNVISCNYIYYQRWCMYLDFASSGVVIDGGLCYGSYAAVKVNGGKYNVVGSLIVAMSSRFLHFISCVTATFGNCFSSTGNNWEALRRKYWNVPAVNARYPFMRTICNPIPSIINRNNCNPNSAKNNADSTGYCSGYSYGSVLQSVWYYGQGVNPYDYNSCKDDTGVDCYTFNRQTSNNVTYNPGFVGGGIAPNLVDFGLKRNSRIYRLYPKFKSCPRRAVGPTKVVSGTNLPSYLRFWNIPGPAQFAAVVNFDFSKIFDTSLQVPKGNFAIQRTSRTVP